jgi:hypothetical protein
MKHRTLAIEGLDLQRLLDEGRRTPAVFLSKKGKVRYVLLHADDGDQEVCAIRNNPELMAYLEECTERAVKGPRHTLEEVKARFGIDTSTGAPARAKDRNGTRPRRVKA